MPRGHTIELTTAREVIRLRMAASGEQYAEDHGFVLRDLEEWRETDEQKRREQFEQATARMLRARGRAA